MSFQLLKRAATTSIYARIDPGAVLDNSHGKKLFVVSQTASGSRRFAFRSDFFEQKRKVHHFSISHEKRYGRRRWVQGLPVTAEKLFTPTENSLGVLSRCVNHAYYCLNLWNFLLQWAPIMCITIRARPFRCWLTKSIQIKMANKYSGYNTYLQCLRPIIQLTYLSLLECLLLLGIYKKLGNKDDLEK